MRFKPATEHDSMKMRALVLGWLFLAVGCAAGGMLAAENEPFGKRLPRNYRNERLPGILRQLAHEARINLIIGDDVLDENPSVTLTLPRTTALEAMKLLARQQDMRLRKVENDYYLQLAPAKRAQWAEARRRGAESKAMSDAGPITQDNAASADLTLEFVTGLACGWNAVHERLAQWRESPAEQQRLAQSRVALANALMGEGFSRAEAIELVKTQSADRHPLLR